MSTCLGFVVQLRDEEEYTPYKGFLKLHRSFSSALLHAQELYKGYLETHEEAYEGPYEVLTPTKKQIQDAGSVVVFRSRDCCIWIDAIIE